MSFIHKSLHCLSKPTGLGSKWSSRGARCHLKSVEDVGSGKISAYKRGRPNADMNDIKATIKFHAYKFLFRVRRMRPNPLAEKWEKMLLQYRLTPAPCLLKKSQQRLNSMPLYLLQMESTYF